MVSQGKRPKLKLTPPDPKEDELQASIASLLNIILDPKQAMFVHFPSGGYFLSPAARARLYRLGLRAGWPDCLICFGVGRVLWLEVKTRTGVTSPAQRVIHMQLRALGQPVVVVRRIEDVITALLEYGVPFKQIRLDGDWYAKSIKQGAATSGTAESAQGASAHPA